MQNIIQSDIFFFIASVATVVLGVILAVGLVYLVKILRDVRYIASKVREESDKIVADVDVLRENAKREGLKIRDMIALFTGFLAFRHKAKKGKGKE